MPLYLVPVPLGDSPLHHVLPSHNAAILLPIRHFIVENIRSARRFLRLVHPDFPIDDLTFFVLNQHTPIADIPSFLAPLDLDLPVALLSDAGCPAIADPGAQVVALAHQRGFTVLPLVGPSSILLALIASGLNGQSFAFHGYLPVNPQDRQHALKRLDNCVHSLRQTQIFIETPYRNNALFTAILHTCLPHTLLCLAANLTSPHQLICTLPISAWLRHTPPDLNHQPTTFLLGAPLPHA
ncbi:MAG: SAM-dependent methyltransferase [Tannerellaceae bacterium]|nr:SAM-dependent methyltransferase [Tannerellaceae bacterium]